MTHDTWQNEKFSLIYGFYFFSFPSFHASLHTHLIYPLTLFFRYAYFEVFIYNTKSLPSNIMHLRDEAFYDFVRQYSGKRVAELLAFQECNGVDSLLACPDIAAILRFQSDDLNDIKRSTCITLTDGAIVLLPGLESSLNNLVKVLKRKLNEFNLSHQCYPTRMASCPFYPQLYRSLMHQFTQLHCPTCRCLIRIIYLQIPL